MPNISKCIDSDDNRCTFVIEDTIAFDSHKLVEGKAKSAGFRF